MPEPVRETFLESLDPQVRAWYAMTPQERWTASWSLHSTYRALGGSYSPDAETVFFDEQELRELDDGGLRLPELSRQALCNHIEERIRAGDPAIHVALVGDEIYEEVMKKLEHVAGPAQEGPERPSE